MARKAAGAVVEHTGRDGRTYRALRFTAYRKRRYVSLGAVGAAEAERRLRHTLADVERGTWQPAAAVEPPPEPPRSPTFHQYAEQWWRLNEGQWAPKTRRDYRWKLEYHLVGWFGEKTLEAITVEDVKAYGAAKLSERAEIEREAAEGKERTVEYLDERGESRTATLHGLSPRSINATITLLGCILEAAVDDELVGRNVARGKRRKVRERRPQRTYIDTAAQIDALLTAARQLDAQAREDRRHIDRHAIVATMLFAGLRIGELCAVRWRHVDLAAGWLHTGSKTDAGVRRVKIRGALRDALDGLRSRAHSVDPDAYVFATSSGAKPSGDNIRKRVLGAAIERANANLDTAGLAPLPDGLTPHSMRRTFASVLYALGEDPGVVMDEMGHADPGLALRIYRQAMRRDDGEKAALRALVEGGQLADGLPKPSQIAANTGQSKAA